MKPSERDAAHLWGMLDAARRTRDMMRGISYDVLMVDERTWLAVSQGLTFL